VAAAAGVLVAILLALLTERFVARPLARASAATKVIATAAVLALLGIWVARTVSEPSMGMS